jgi:hypothetical protein
MGEEFGCPSNQMQCDSIKYCGKYMWQFEKYKELFMFGVRETSVTTGIDLATKDNGL